MGYLVLTRHQGDQTHLTIDPAADSQETLLALLNGWMEIEVARATTMRASIPGR